MSAQVIIRDGRAADAADLAILDNIAGHGLSLWFWQGAVKMGKARDALEWGRARMMSEDSPFGWRNARIAERDGETAGAATSYQMPRVDMNDAKAEAPQIKPVFELFAQVEGAFVLDALAVFENHLRSGVARALLGDFFDRARSADCAEMAIVTDDQNEPARSLYESVGFSITDTRPLIPHSEKINSENWLLYTRSTPTGPGDA